MHHSLPAGGDADEDFQPSAAFCRALDREDDYDDNDAIAMGATARGLGPEDEAGEARPAAGTEVRGGQPLPAAWHAAKLTTVHNRSASALRILFLGSVPCSCLHANEAATLAPL